MHALAILLLLAAAQTVKEDRTALRTGCEAGDETVALLAAGTPVAIRFAINGCLAVTVGELRGYLPPSAIVNADKFDRARREANSVNSKGGAAPAAKDPMKLALAGRDAYYADNLDEALGLLKDSLAIKEDADVRRFLERVEREAATGLGKARLLSSRFLLRYGSMEVEDARAMLALLEEEFTRIAAEIGCHPEGRMNVILQSREDYLRTSGMAEWSAGVYDGRIRVSLQKSDQTRMSISHELVHACLASTGNWPAWLHEGLAQKLSGQVTSPARRAVVRELTKKGGLPKLAQMNQTFSGLNAANASIAYAAAAMAVELFYANYRDMGIANLVRSPERLPAIAEDLDRLLHGK